MLAGDDYSSPAPSEGIVRGFDLREPLHTGGMDLSDPVLDCEPVDVFFVLAITESSFERDKLALLERPGKLGEIAPGEDAMPFGPDFVVAFIVLPALLGSDMKTTNSRLFWEVFASAFCPRRPMRMILLNMVFSSVSFGLCPLDAIHACPTGVPSRPPPKANERDLGKGTTATSGGRSPHLEEARIADHGKESVRPQAGES
jgi:hypothetical protein